MWWKVKCSLCLNIYCCCQYVDDGGEMPNIRVDYCFNNNGTLNCWEICGPAKTVIQGMCNVCRAKGESILQKCPPYEGD